MLLSPSGLRIAHVALGSRCLGQRTRNLSTVARTLRGAVRIVPGPSSTFTSRPERCPALRSAFLSSASLHTQARSSMSSTPSDVRQRRTMATDTGPSDKPERSHDHSHDHSHANNHSHDHSHSHGIFGHTHEHDGTSENAQQVVNAFQNTADAGSRITLIGLFANIGLTSAKGLAGWYMNSAALLADAGHSFSDLVGDFVTLFCWRLSRRPPSARYPYGFAKFETVGTLAVAFLLIAGGLGIAVHATTLLLQALAAPVAALPPDSILVSIYDTVSHIASHLPVGHSHGHGGVAHAHDVVDHAHGVLDANAAWFAAGSVVAKEWLYRVTKRVADAEHSPVLLANALHHRSDAASSLVALVAIGGTVLFPHVPLDPLGGFLVSVVILQQGLAILSGSAREFTDASVSPKTKAALMDALAPFTSYSETAPTIRAITDLRARRAGAKTFVEVTAQVNGAMPVAESAQLESKIAEALRKVRGEVDVVVRFVPDEHR